MAHLSMNGIEETVKTWLISKGIYPFSVLYSRDPQFLKLSFFIKTDLEELLDITDYKTTCDHSGIQIFDETYTILYSDASLINFFRYVDNQTI